MIGVVKHVAMNNQTTITAIATPAGRGGVSIIRVSGPKAKDIAADIFNKPLPPRLAQHGAFLDKEGETIDLGLALFFPGPHSFTGEDVVELHGHGGPVITDVLLQRVLALGAQLARPGEFSERAFLNDKIDLAQAEAIADLIDSSSTQAARAAMRSLQGVFSSKVKAILAQLIKLRVYIEAAIDFPEEEIDFLADDNINKSLAEIIDATSNLLKEAGQGVLLKEGLQVVIAGPPNAGKSSLLNCLAGYDSAIVTSIPGTTRDVLKENIHIDGLPLHIIDTAGLHSSSDEVEQEGMRRAEKAIAQADLVLLLCDISQSAITAPQQIWENFDIALPENTPIIIVQNKIDLTNDEPVLNTTQTHPTIKLSVKTNQGIDLLKQQLKEYAGYQSDSAGDFSARRRHLDALTEAKKSLLTGQQQLEQHKAGELLAEDLRSAQQALGKITGDYTADDLLGEIFSSFCIGK